MKAQPVYKQTNVPGITPQPNLKLNGSKDLNLVLKIKADHYTTDALMDEKLMKRKAKEFFNWMHIHLPHGFIKEVRKLWSEHETKIK